MSLTFRTSEGIVEVKEDASLPVSRVPAGPLETSPLSIERMEKIVVKKAKSEIDDIIYLGYHKGGGEYHFVFVEDEDKILWFSEVEDNG